jgi:hypothetical protein
MVKAGLDTQSKKDQRPEDAEVASLLLVPKLFKARIGVWLHPDLVVFCATIIHPLDKWRPRSRQGWSKKINLH